MVPTIPHASPLRLIALWFWRSRVKMSKRGIESQHGGALVQALVLEETKLVDITEMKKVNRRLGKEW